MLGDADTMKSSLESEKSIPGAWGLNTYWIRNATIIVNNEWNGSASWSFDREEELNDENSNWCEI